MTHPPAQPQFTPTKVPSRIAELGFSALVPSDFRTIPLPAEEPTFDKPEYFLPLFVAMAPYGAVVFSAVARPAYDDGSVEDWARFHASRQEGSLLSLDRGVIGGLQAIVCEAVQPSDAGAMHIRFVFVEDGGRLILVSAMAPEQIWPSVSEMLGLSISSFRLDTPRGQSAPVTREEAARRAASAPPPQPPAPAAPSGPADTGSPTSAADVALADDASSLDLEHRINASLAGSGRGLVPRVLEVNTQEKYAVLGAAAIMSTFRVPLGWHATDDTRRTLIFDADQKIQVNLSIRECGPDHGAFLDGLLQEHLAQQAGIQHLRLDIGGMQCLALRNYKVNDEVLEQTFLVKDIGAGTRALVCRVTAGAEHMVRAMNVAEVILTHLRYMGQSS